MNHEVWRGKGEQDWSDLVLVERVLHAFGLGGPNAVAPLGGTATPKFAVELPSGRFVVRIRPHEFSSERMTRFDHEALVRLAANGLPVPCPQKRPNGTTWLRVNGAVIEVLSWVDGEPFTWDDIEAVRNVGTFLAQFHTALSDNIPAGKEGFCREDDPGLLAPYVDRLDDLCRDEDQRQGLDEIRQELDRVRRELDEKLWPELPKTVIHGDIHTGNVYFRDSCVAAVYDFDYISLQARLRDVCDALMFFASLRHRPVEPDNIYSLTAPYRLDLQRAAILLEGYHNTIRLTEYEWNAIPWILRSQWCQIRLRGSRKVPEQQKLAFVLDRFLEQVDWLDRTLPELVLAVRTQLENAEQPRPG